MVEGEGEQLQRRAIGREGRLEVVVLPLQESECRFWRGTVTGSRRQSLPEGERRRRTVGGPIRACCSGCLQIPRLA